MAEFEQKSVYDMQDLLQIVALLRSPDGGCPWDIQQTHESIKMNFLEEAYEVTDAIEQADSHMLCEELGDVLLQVAFHAQIETEASTFSFGDVTDGICKKLIYRHPHVFGDVVAETSGEVLQNWEALKRAEKGRLTAKENLSSVPKNLPALLRAEKLSKRAGDCGVQFASPAAALDALEMSIKHLREAIADGTDAAKKDELGDVLLGTAHVARLLKINAEEALGHASDAFTARVVALQDAPPCEEANKAALQRI
ncbi:MAG: nucleoside triphosphate pyrophosphohydrolase [Oscillospiraceae bacterium]|nr:nucleoside triphosphate pyrophosphohydrolase [Oscillospiraceae bacterium]